MKYSLPLMLFLCLLAACRHDRKTERELPSDSIFQLSSTWQNQNGDSLRLKDLRGKTLVVVMIYTSCKTACPRLVARMKNIESKIEKNSLQNTSLVLVSIDPETDTPQHLKAFAKNNNMDQQHWVFLRSNEQATQEFANVLSMKYKKISPVDFSHSNIISVFSPDGQLIIQEEGIDIDVDKIASIIKKTSDKL